MHDDLEDLRLRPLEPTEGQGTPTSAGERLLIGLAAIVLGTGLVLGVASSLGGDDEPPSSRAEAETSDPESATPRPSRTPRPTPEPRSFTLMEGTPPSVRDEAPEWFFGWVRALADVPIHASADTDAAVVGTLAAGEVAWAYADPYSGSPDWLTVELTESGARQGQIPAIGADGPTVERFTEAMNSSSEIWSVVAGPNGFLASGSADQMGLRTFTLASADGAAWQPVDPARLPASFAIRTLAHGPSGWLAITYAADDQGRETATFWRSETGTDAWEPLGWQQDQFVHSLVGGDAGYLVIASGEFEPMLLFSTDGRSWRETRIGTDSSPWDWTLVPTGSGFHAVRAGFGARGSYAFSADGLTWTTSDGPHGQRPLIAELGHGGLLAVDVDDATGTASVLRGSVAAGYPQRVAWEPVEPEAGVLDGVVVTAVADDDTTMFLFGWDRATEDALVLSSSDGVAWRRETMPDAFGGPPQLAAGSSRGVVVVGHRPTLAGSNPVFWRRAGGSWVPEASPAIEAAPDTAADACPPPPGELLDLIALPRSTAASCWSGRSLTFPAWVSRSPGPAPGGAGSFEPDWLASTFSGGDLGLAPIKAGEAFGGYGAVSHPSLEATVRGETLMDVTGHFDDPAAARCAWDVPRAEEAWYPGRRAVVIQCRVQFVVTALEEVNAP